MSRVDRVGRIVAAKKKPAVLGAGEAFDDEGTGMKRMFHDYDVSCPGRAGDKREPVYQDNLSGRNGRFHAVTVHCVQTN